MPYKLDDINAAYTRAMELYRFTNPTGSVILPPPNVTGNLHIGHALNLFIQDLFIRFYKLTGTEISWIPGTDHAGIAAQLLVKNKLAQEGILNLSTSELVDKIWEWKDKYEANICAQIHQMGTLLDWSGYKFTLDTDVQQAVAEAFCKLHENGLIFRDKRIVNWDTSLQTVISDIESMPKEVDGVMWYIKYTSDEGEEVEVATTRPETIFADEAIAVHPDDLRYKHLHWEKFHVPLSDKKVPMIPDYGCDPDKGSGVVKIDPAHGFLDFEIAMRNRLPVVPIIDKSGKMCGDVPDSILGLDRFAAREKVVEQLAEYITRSEQIVHPVPHGIRSGTILEPIATDQWFFNMKQLAPRAREILEQDEIVLTPHRFKDVYLKYIDNIQPWCISRQIAWGHKIPAWYDDDGRIYITTNPEILPNINLRQDPDVLDTWFSSALWPIINAGWPGNDLKHYPNEFLITGSDILFFWVTKMIMMHIGLLGDAGVPFKVVLLHGLVQDEYGAKMSKSKGNVVDPMDLLQEHGRDVLGFALISSSPSGNNVKFGAQNIDKSKKFLNKVWNGLNFALGIAISKKVQVNHFANKWILKSVNDFEKNIHKYLMNWDVYNATNSLYQFFWNEFCDWYIEASKYLINQNNLFTDETKYTMYLTVRKLLKIAHPFLPQISEYFWQKLEGNENILANYAEIDDDYNAYDDNEFTIVREVVSRLRSIKSHFAVKSGCSIMIGPNMGYHSIELIEHLAKVKIEQLYSDDLIEFGLCGYKVSIPRDMCGVTDVKECAVQIINKINHDIDILNQQLNDAGFMSNADQVEIESKRIKLDELRKDLQVYQSSIGLVST